MLGLRKNSTVVDSIGVADNHPPNKIASPLADAEKLTYMFIRDVINQAVACGKLFPARPVASWSGEVRAFFMCDPLRLSIEQGKLSPLAVDRQPWAAVEAAIGYFVEGNPVTDNLMKQLLPPKFEHWELRNRRPRPSMRVFGRFADKDVFIGTHVKLRKELGGMNSAQFEQEKLVCEQYWLEAGLQAHFSDAPNFRYDAYMSNAKKKVRVPA